MKRWIFMAPLLLALAISWAAGTPAVGDPSTQTPVVTRWVPYYPYPTHQDALTLRIGFGDTVEPIAPARIPGAKTSTLPMPKASGPPDCPANGDIVVAQYQSDEHSNRFCVTASAAGLNVRFERTIPFTTVISPTCAEIPGSADETTSHIIAVVARVGGNVAGNTVYDASRVECDVDAGFSYAQSVERLSTSNLVRAGDSGSGKWRTITVPWNLLHVGTHATGIMMAISICAQDEDRPCTTHGAQAEIQIPVRIVESNSSIDVQYAPYTHSGNLAPTSAATPMRLYHIGADGLYSWDHHEVAMASFAQDQSAVAAQQALSQTLGLTPLSLPVSSPAMAVAQTLQSRSQP
ncbi:MAG TPA: hypothetical protein VGD50_00105, partial [Candidatus Baltobacteraceae bacterium]